MSRHELTATPGAKMMYLIRRKPTTSRDELVAHWFANHMPLVIKAQETQAAQGRRHATRYLATLFDADKDGSWAWDGVAQLWWDRELRPPSEPHATMPTDTFQQKAEPYVSWATTEYVVIDGSDRLAVVPNTLNAPFPCTRTGFAKITVLTAALPGTDFEALFAHWLGVHAPNAREVIERVGGYRYVVSHSLHPETEPFAGMAELYFADFTGWRRYLETVKPDGMERWVDSTQTVVLRGRTEMIGIP